jgi:hypothetical protein
MKNSITFHYKGAEHSAEIYISYSEEILVFCKLKDDTLIQEFGNDINFKTDGESVLSEDTCNKEYFILQVAILEAAKRLPDFDQIKRKTK